jgi:hypothetical protein
MAEFEQGPASGTKVPAPGPVYFQTLTLHIVNPASGARGRPPLGLVCDRVTPATAEATLMRRRLGQRSASTFSALF